MRQANFPLAANALVASAADGNTLKSLSTCATSSTARLRGLNPAIASDCAGLRAAHEQLHQRANACAIEPLNICEIEKQGRRGFLAQFAIESGDCLEIQIPVELHNLWAIGLRLARGECKR